MLQGNLLGTRKQDKLLFYASDFIMASRNLLLYWPRYSDTESPPEGKVSSKTVWHQDELITLDWKVRNSTAYTFYMTTKTSLETCKGKIATAVHKIFNDIH